MQKFIEFFELDKDGTWFVVFCFIAVVILIDLIYKGIRNLVYYIRKKRTDGAELYKQELLLKLIQNDEFELEKASMALGTFSGNIDKAIHNIQAFSESINRETKNVDGQRTEFKKE